MSITKQELESQVHALDSRLAEAEDRLHRVDVNLGKLAHPLTKLGGYDLHDLNVRLLRLERETDPVTYRVLGRDAIEFGRYSVDVSGQYERPRILRAWTLRGLRRKIERRAVRARIEIQVVR